MGAFAGIPLSAKFAKVRLSSTNTLGASEWDITPKSVWEPAPHFDGGGFIPKVACLRDADVTIAGWLDEGNMFDAPLGVVDGTKLTNVRCYINDVTGPFWNFPTFDVESVNVVARVENKILYRIHGFADGTYSYPTGSF